MSLSITRHPDDANFMSYAAGALAEPLAAAVAAHVSMCARCGSELRGLQALGGVLLDGQNDDAFVTQLHVVSLPVPDQKHETVDRTARRGALAGLPAPIGRRYGLDLASMPWRWLGPGIRYHSLALSPGVVGDLRLLKIAPGRRMPEHGHGGCEMTLVLDGAYSDDSGAFRRGDIQDVDDELEHRPVVDPKEGCICLVASERPARFKGVFSRLLQPWTGM